MFYCVVIVCDWSSISNVDWMIHPRYHPLQQSWNRNIQTVHLIIINGWPRFKCIKEGHIMCMRYHCIVTIVLDTSVLHQPTDNHSLPMTHGLVEYEFYAQCISAYVLPYLRTHLRAWIDQCVQIFFMFRVSMMMMMIVRSVFPYPQDVSKGYTNTIQYCWDRLLLRGKKMWRLLHKYLSMFPVFPQEWWLSYVR